MIIAIWGVRDNLKISFSTPPPLTNKNSNRVYDIVVMIKGIFQGDSGLSPPIDYFFSLYYIFSPIMAGEGESTCTYLCVNQPVRLSIRINTRWIDLL